jgi:hypothetical protein
VEVRASCLLCSGRTAAACRTASWRGVGRQPGWDLGAPGGGLHGQARSGLQERRRRGELALHLCLVVHPAEPSKLTPSFRIWDGDWGGYDGLSMNGISKEDRSKVR